MFDKNSGIVKVWINLIKKQRYSIEDVPELANLKEVVISILDSNN